MQWRAIAGNTQTRANTRKRTKHAHTNTRQTHNTRRGQSSARALAEDGEAKGNAVAQILHDAFLARFGSARAGVALQAVPIGGVFFCLVATTT